MHPMITMAKIRPIGSCTMLRARASFAGIFFPSG